MVDPAKFTLEYCEQALRNSPIDTAAFEANVMRLLNGKPWKRFKQEQPKLRKATAQSQAGNLARMANGGLSKTAKANHA